MFSKIIIRNVGVLKAFDTPGAPKLAQLSLFYGRNGRGKSTLTAVMRAARDGCSSTVLARTSLGNGGAAPEVTLVGDSGNVRFNNGKWDRKDAPIEVFDSAFIADNIYAGELIDLAHDRGLFSIIIGKKGVKLATHLDRFNAIARQTSADLKAADAALIEDRPADMKLDEFFALGPNPDYAKQLDDAERALKAVQLADKIAALKSPEEITVPALPADTAAALESTVADIDASARDRLLEHFKRFELDKKAEEWISYGLEHVHDDACAFCGREGVDAEGMVTLYGQIFGENGDTTVCVPVFPEKSSGRTAGRQPSARPGAEDSFPSRSHRCIQPLDVSKKHHQSSRRKLPCCRIRDAGTGKKRHQGHVSHGGIYHRPLYTERPDETGPD